MLKMRWVPFRDKQDAMIRILALLFLVLLTVPLVVIIPMLETEQRYTCIICVIGFMLGRWSK